MEQGKKSIKSEFIIKLAKIYQTDQKDLLTLWLADQILSVIDDKKELATNALNIALKTLNNEQ